MKKNEKYREEKTKARGFGRRKKRDFIFAFVSNILNSLVECLGLSQDEKTLSRKQRETSANLSNSIDNNYIPCAIHSKIIDSNPPPERSLSLAACSLFSYKAVYMFTQKILPGNYTLVYKYISI